MPDDLLERARKLNEAGQLAEAAGLYHQVLRSAPRQFEALYALGLIYFRTGQFERAEYLLKEAGAADPGFTDAFAWRGIALLNLKRHREAIACFDRVLSVRPRDPDALGNRATVLFELRRFDESLAAFDAALSVDAGHAVSWNNRGNLLLALGRHIEALDSYERALLADPHFDEAWLNRLRLFRLANGDAELAGALRARGEELLSRRCYEKALARFDDSLLVVPNSAQGFTGRAMAVLGLGRREEALKWLEIALGIDHEYSHASQARESAKHG
jgi:tetratricopeptide (TPR) repeat protein